MTKPEDWFTQLKQAYPKRSKGKAYAWPAAFKQLQMRLREGHSFEDILQGTKDYCAATKLSGDYGSEYVKQASTFYGPGLHFLDEYETEDPTPEVVYRRPRELTAEEKQRERLKGENNLRQLQEKVKGLR
jgi:hypothetical protein